MRKSASPRSTQRTARPLSIARPSTGFVGRTAELSLLKQLLAQTRCLTLTGVGGCGKTRLALQLADELSASRTFKQGVFWVGLDSLSDPALVPQAVADALGLRESQGRPMHDVLGHYLRQKRLLLVVDNCEHVRSACAALIEPLLGVAPHLQILATSREPLGVSAERTWLVPSLSFPEHTGGVRASSGLEQYDAVQLFVQRAAAVLPGFTLTPRNAALIVQVCQQLDGLPLALELAAARVKLLTLEQISARLDKRLVLLTSGNPTVLLPRHRTLRTAIDWSYDLLPETERTLFRRLSVFAGGFTLDAAEDICAGEGIEPEGVLDLLASLMDQSLLIAETQERSEARFRMLETIRQYASETLSETREDAGLRFRHLCWYLAFAEKAEPNLRGPEQMLWLERLEGEHDNLRAAMAYARNNAGAEAGSFLRLAGSLFWFWNLHGHWSEGRRWLEQALAQSAASAQSAARARALLGAGELAMLQGEFAAARIQAEESADIARALGNRQVLAYALNRLGNLAWIRGDHPRAQSWMKESLAIFREIQDDWGSALSLLDLGDTALREGSLTSAQTLMREGLEIFTRLGDRRGRALALMHLATAHAFTGDYERAHAELEETLAVQREIGDPWVIAHTLNRLGEIARSQGDDERAASLYTDSLRLHRELGNQSGVAMVLHNLAHASLHSGDRVRAAQFFTEALALNRERDNSLGMAACLGGLAGVAAAGGQAEQAARLFGAVDAVLETIGLVLDGADQIEYRRNVACARDRLDHDAYARQWNEGRTLTLDQAVGEGMRVQDIVHDAARAGSAALVEQLNEREREVLRCIADGLSNQEIAERLTIAPGTVKWHITNLFGKLGVRSRTQALVRAKALGLP